MHAERNIFGSIKTERSVNHIVLAAKSFMPYQKRLNYVAKVNMTSAVMTSESEKQNTFITDD